MAIKLDEILSTLGEDARFLSDTILESARELFNKDGGCSPVVFWVEPFAKKIQVMGIPVPDDETKPAVWDAIRDLRLRFPVVMFVSETWMSHLKGMSKEKAMEHYRHIMPRDDPNRTETLMIQLWEGRRAVTFMADITRNPTKLGEWTVLYDSLFPGNDGNGIEKVEGALMDGKPCQMEGN